MNFKNKDSLQTEINLRSCRILGVNVHGLTLTELHDYIFRYITQRQHALVLNVNVHCLNLAYEDSSLRHFLNSADLVFCDGVGVILGTKLLGHTLPKRITYADWMWQLAAFSELNDFSFFFVGSKPDVANQAATRLKERFPNLKILGTHHGYFDKSGCSIESEAVINQINTAKPDILVVGFGMPVQEQWLMENWDRIDANVALTGGAVFDYISGELRRGPRILTDNGFEWLARLLIEPRRLWKRYIIGNPLFLWRILKQRFGYLPK